MAEATLEERVVALENAVARISANTQELVTIFNHAKNTVTVFLFLAKFAKWLAPVLVAIGAIWAFIHALKTGHPPSS